MDGAQSVISVPWIEFVQPALEAREQKLTYYVEALSSHGLRGGWLAAAATLGITWLTRRLAGRRRHTHDLEVTTDRELLLTEHEKKAVWSEIVGSVLIGVLS